MASLSDWIDHADSCLRCKPGEPCAEGVAIFKAARDATVARMLPIEVVDLPGHRTGCVECRTQRLCDVGRQLAEAQTDAWLDAAAHGWVIR